MRILAMILALTLSTPTWAQAVTVDADQRVHADKAYSYADIIELAVPDLVESNGVYSGTLMPELRSIPYPEDTPIQHVPVRFSTVETMPFLSGGKQHFGLLIDPADEDSFASILLVVELEGTPRLVDVVDIGADQHSGFAEQSLLAIGDADEALITSSAHFNSSQGYRLQSVIGLIDGKLVELASVFTLRENYCGVDRQQTATITPLVSLTDGYGPFTIAVAEATLPTADDCDEQKLVPGTRSAATTYIWNAALHRYVPDNNAIDDLNSDTEQRF